MTSVRTPPKGDLPHERELSLHMTYAYWRKCDFQVHTPRDPNWKGPRPVGEGDELNGVPASPRDVDEQRHAWAVKFVDQCVARRLEVVAVTDHHEMVMIPYIKAAIEERKKENADFDLWLMPGMELTCRNGVQCLILFDSDLGTVWLEAAQAKLGIVRATIRERHRQGPPVTQLDCHYPDLVEKIEKISELKGRYIILPNVSDGGQHTVVRNAMHADFARMPYVGGYLDNGQNINNLQGKLKRRLSGKEDIWGGRFVYPLPTSDARSDDFQKLGTNDCWIKMASPTAEGVRQAFLGHMSRISLVPPSLTSIAVRRVKVSGSAIFGEIDLDISPELNSVIGGRGSGKSSFLEYIAFGLGRSCFDLGKKAYSGQGRLEDLIRDTLITPSAQVELHLTQDGAPFRIQRGPKNGYAPKVTYPNGDEEEVPLKDLRALFPGVVYSQGELSEIGKKAEQKAKLADLLQFVDPQYKLEDDAMTRLVEEAKREVRSSLQELSVAWEAEAELHKLETLRASTAQRAEALEKNLPVLPEADQQKMSRFETLQGQDRTRLTCARHAQTVVEALQSVGAHAEPFPEFSNVSEETTAVQVAYGNFVNSFREGFAALYEKLIEEMQKISEASAGFAETLEKARADRNVVIEKMTEHRAATDQIGRLRSEMQSQLEQVEQLKSQMPSAETSLARVEESLNQLKQRVTDRADRTKNWADMIVELSDRRVDAEVEFEKDLAEIFDGVDHLVSKTGSQTGTRHQKLQDAINERGVWTIAEAMLRDCLEVLRWQRLHSSATGNAPDCAALSSALGVNGKSLENLRALMDLPRVEALATAVPAPAISLYYCDGERRISFDKASEGQRAAALLFMLLEQPGGPPMIDQPEGDLDNKIVSELADKLHAAKQKRQIFFASHNANIVVNGSSELVVGMDVAPEAKRAVDCSGAIDSNAICLKITETMEGGKKAFSDRKDKYGY